MRIAIIGAGGVGGYFGGRLAASGADVAFIARGAHLRALQTGGLTVLSELGTIERLPVRATDDPSSIAAVDAILMTVKLTDTESAIALARPMVGPDTAVVSLQNGVDAVGMMSAAFGRAQVLGGACYIAAAIERPGVIRHTGSIARIALGELDGRRTPRLSALVSACTAAGVDVAEPPDIGRAIWEKFVFVSAFSGVTALARSAIGPLRERNEGRLLIARAVAESTAVARAHGIALPQDHTDKVVAFIAGLPGSTRASLLHDLERGARLELPWLSGAVVRLGGEKGVPVPVHETIVGALGAYADGRR